MSFGKVKWERKCRNADSTVVERPVVALLLGFEPWCCMSCAHLPGP